MEVPEERRRLMISTRPLGPDRVQILVEDAGPGIDQATLRHLFDPFFSTKETGMGMGLAISQTIIQDHKGSITVDSTPGAGTVFRVTLPLYAAAYAKEREPRCLSR
jgi:signal transduction histidine kinase